MGRPARTESRAEEATGRETRVPLGLHRAKLTFQGRKGYVRRVVNDLGGRLEAAQNAGYQFVESEGKSLGDPDIDNVNRDLGSRISRVVDKTTGAKAFLMEIKEDFYKEDQAKKAADLDVTDQQIRKGKLDPGESRYVPESGIAIETR